MKGFVPTPDAIVDLMVDKLFHGRPPSRDSMLLDPGCGTGAFIEGVIRWCRSRQIACPRIVGIEMDPLHVARAREKLNEYSQIEIRQEDFLASAPGTYDYIVGNPPYVPITGLSEEEKRRYRSEFRLAKGRFDLYLLFFEQALKNLKSGGRLVFITPEKYVYTETASRFRVMASRLNVEEIQLIMEEAFGKLVTYPTITTITNEMSRERTRVSLRDGTVKNVHLPSDGSSWIPTLNGGRKLHSKTTLDDVCNRISCGVATGADAVYVKSRDEISPSLLDYSYPTIAGRQLGHGNPDLETSHVMIVPYDRNGRLLDEDRLGALGQYLSQPAIRSKLMGRTCATRKNWYAFHDSMPTEDMLRQKILCKDITQKPHFWVDRTGGIVPRHTVYYAVPKDESRIDELCEYLNSGHSTDWLMSNCQRAANGFIRLQSNVLRRLPVPDRLRQDTPDKKCDKPKE